MIPNPRPARVLEAGDRLLCFGKLESMRDMISDRTRRARTLRVRQLSSQEPQPARGSTDVTPHRAEPSAGSAPVAPEPLVSPAVHIASIAPPHIVSSHLPSGPLAAAEEPARDGQPSVAIGSTAEHITAEHITATS